MASVVLPWTIFQSRSDVVSVVRESVHITGYVRTGTPGTDQFHFQRDQFHDKVLSNLIGNAFDEVFD